MFTFVLTVTTIFPQPRAISELLNCKDTLTTVYLLLTPSFSNLNHTIMQIYGRKQETVERNANERDEGIPKYLHLRLDLSTGAIQLHNEATEKKQTDTKSEWN